MFDSVVFNVAIGVIFLYLLLSLICSAVTEGISRFFAIRSGNLKTGIRNLLNDPEGNGLARDFYNHPLIKGLYHPGLFDRLFGKGGKPSYIPPRTFAFALFDIVAPAGPETTSKTESERLAEVRNKVAQIPNEEVKRALLVFIDNANGKLETARENVERWFDDAMERAGGWYKRKTQLIILGVAAAVTLVLNADTFILATSLWNDPTLRESILTAAQQATQQPLPDEVAEIEQELERLQIPLGWDSAPCWWYSLASCSFMLGLQRILGLLFTALALSLGAPFWFDLLNKFVNIRDTGQAVEPVGTQPEDGGRTRS